MITGHGRRILTALTVFALIVSGCNGYPTIAKFVQSRLSDDDWLNRWDHVAGIVGGTLAVVLALIAFLRWLWTRDRQPLPAIINADTGRPLRTPQTLVDSYYAELDDQCEFLRLDMIASPLGERRLGLALSDIYQDQQIRLLDQEPAEPGHVSPTRPAIPLMEALAQLNGNRLVIRGPVGAGKSSFINFLTHRLIQSRHETPTDLPACLTRRPVGRLILRKVSIDGHEGETGSAGILWRGIKADARVLIGRRLDREDATPMSDAEFDPFWSAFRGDFEQRGVLLLDGLDEVSKSNNLRGRFLEAIGNFAVQFPKIFIVLTGRPYAYQHAEQRLTGFQTADLEPMSEPQVRQFVRHWYRVARGPNNWSERQATDRAGELVDEIFARPYLPDLAARPMLLTLFIGLDYANIRLPASRAKLFEEAIELMLQRWTQNLKDTRDSLDEAERHGLEVLERSRDELLRALRKLAFNTLDELRPTGAESESPALEFSHEQVLGHLYGRLAAGADHEKLLHFLQFRSGLLIAGSGEDSFQFAHKSFHEYLAACHLLEQTNWKHKVKGLMESSLDWWREVFLLLTKKYSDTQYGEAVSFLHGHLLRRYRKDGEDTTDPFQQRLLLTVATAALELGIAQRASEDELYAECVSFLRSALVGLLQAPTLTVPERAEAGDLLGSLGDPRTGVTVQQRDGHTLWRQQGEHRHALPDIGWQWIPEGRFRMGTDGDEGFASEKPAHELHMSGFLISRYPITNAQFRCFVDAGMYADRAFWDRRLPAASRDWLSGKTVGAALIETISEEYREAYRLWVQQDSDRCRPRFWNDRRWANPNHPVVGVSWFEALAYCTWLNDWLTEVCPGQELKQRLIRLPTEAEWEYAARGERGFKYAWGHNADPMAGNYDNAGIGRTSSVGLFPPGAAFGVHDQSGNVWEWTGSRWGSDFNVPSFTYADWTEQDPIRNALEPVEFRIARGGSWFSSDGFVRCAVRYGGRPDFRCDFLGFRVVCVGVLPG